MNRDDDDRRIFGVRQATKLDLEMMVVAFGAPESGRVRDLRVTELRFIIAREQERLPLLSDCVTCGAPAGRACRENGAPVPAHVRRFESARIDREREIRDAQIRDGAKAPELRRVGP